MRLPKLLGFSVLLIVGAFEAGAQEAPAPAPPTPRPAPPAPPYVNETPDYSAWTIGRFTIPGLGSQPVDVVARNAAAAAKPDSQTNVTKTGPIRHQVRKLKSGEQEDVWFERGNRITMESIWKMPVFQGETSSLKSPVGPDFPEFSWVSAKNFAGTQEAQSNTYLVFESQVAEGNATQAKEYGYDLKSMSTRAYINADTRLPWLLQTGDIVQRYSFQTAPTTQLEVPAEYQALFDGYERRKIESRRKPIAP